MGRVLLWKKRKRRVKSGPLFQLRDDPRETPIYSVAEAAGYIGVPRSTLRHWLKPTSKSRALIEADPKTGLLSFYNLLEAHILRIALERDAWLQRIRAGVEQLRERDASLHPLLNRQLYTASGYRSLFAMTVAGDVENLSAGGQLEFRQLLKRYLSRIEWDSTGPYQVRPYGYRHVGINYRVSGGRPVIAGTGILVEMIASRLRAGETVPDLARDYQISASDVRDAKRYSAA